MKKTLFFALMLLLSLTALAGKTIPYTHTDSIGEGESNYTTVSLIEVSPSEVIYSALGHSAIRLECPVHDLDLCCTLEVDLNHRWTDYLTFFAGKSNAAICEVPTDVFFGDYQKEGRGVTQYELNFTAAQKAELWKRLEEEAAQRPERKFNYLKDNCTSALLYIMAYSLQPEHFLMNWPEPMVDQPTGEVVLYATRHSPWNRFWSMTLLGSEADARWPYENLTSPELLPQALMRSQIQDAGSATRPAVVSKREIIPVTHTPQYGIFTPMLTFGLLLAIVVAVTLIEWLFRMKKLARWLDVALYGLQTVSGIVLMYMSFVSCLFGAHWNWYLIVFNPIPLLLWLTCRKRAWYPRVYWVYTVVLVVFILATPLSVQLDMEHQLITASFAVRTLCAALAGKQIKTYWPRA